MMSKKELKQQLDFQISHNANLLGRAVDAEERIRDIRALCAEAYVKHASGHEVVNSLLHILDERPWMQTIRDKQELPTIKEYIDQQIDKKLEELT